MVTKSILFKVTRIIQGMYTMDVGNLVGQPSLNSAYLYEFFIYFANWPLIRYTVCRYLLLFHFVGSFLCCAKAL